MSTEIARPMNCDHCKFFRPGWPYRITRHPAGHNEYYRYGECTNQMTAADLLRKMGKADTIGSFVSIIRGAVIVRSDCRCLLGFEPA